MMKKLNEKKNIMVFTHQSIHTQKNIHYIHHNASKNIFVVVLLFIILRDEARVKFKKKTRITMEIYGLWMKHLAHKIKKLTTYSRESLGKILSLFYYKKYKLWIRLVGL